MLLHRAGTMTCSRDASAPPPTGCTECSILYLTSALTQPQILTCLGSGAWGPAHGCTWWFWVEFWMQCLLLAWAAAGGSTRLASPLCLHLARLAA